MREATFALAGMPVLAAGSHPDPSGGGCFMEYASLLAGEAWSDRPRCTHPALAQLARMINDASAQRDRQRLLPLIADVIGVAGDEPAVTPTLVLLCLAHAPEVQPQRWATAAARVAARRHVVASGGGLGAYRCRLTDPVYRLGHANWIMARTVLTLARDEPHAARRLSDLLTDAIAVTRSRLAAGRQPVRAQRDTEAVARAPVGGG